MALNGGSRRRRWRPVLAGRGAAGDMAIDLGTANTVIYVRGSGIVLSEPSVVAVDERVNEVYAVGVEAQRMIGRTPAAISATRPLRHGVIADFEVTEQMLRQFMAKVVRNRWTHPRLVMCAPSGITDVERRAMEEASLSAGARQVSLIEEPLAAAIGAGVPIAGPVGRVGARGVGLVGGRRAAGRGGGGPMAEPIGRMVVDVGGGTSEVAIISLGGIVVSRSVRVGGYDLDEAIGTHIRTEHRMAIGSQSAEEIKKVVGSAAPLATELATMVRGRDLLSGLPRELDLGSAEVRGALANPLSEIMTAIHETLEETPPELAGDLARHGILLAGGGSLLHGFAERVEAETGMPAYLAESPLTCVAVGAGHALEELDVLTRGLRGRA